jgi:hypothetical protein
MGIDLSRRYFAVGFEHFTSAGSDDSTQVVTVAKMPILLQMFPDVRHGVSAWSLELIDDVTDLHEW